MTLQGEGDDVTGSDVTKRGGDITGEKENDVTLGDVAGMAVSGNEDVPGAGNYVAKNYIAKVCGNLRPRRDEDVARVNDRRA